MHVGSRTMTRLDKMLANEEESIHEKRVDIEFSASGVPLATLMMPDCTDTTLSPFVVDTEVCG